MPSEKITAIYLRVSSKNQDHRSQTPDLKRWEEAHDADAKWYRDKFTGKTMDRPAMNRLLADIEAGKIRRVVVWRLDRLGRTAAGLTQLFDDLRARKVDLVSLKDGFSLNTPGGRLLANVMASVAQYETEVRAERVIAGQEAARTKGKTWGGSEKGWHYKANPDKIKIIHQMHAQGAKKTAIARATGLHRHSVSRIIKDAEAVKS